MQLIAGTDSTWSLRAWICLQLAGVQFETTVIRLDQPGYQEQLASFSPSGLVPVLKDGAFSLHDSLAIAEYVNELADGAIHPQEQKARALARSLCAELHSGFIALRTACPFTLNSGLMVDVTPAIKKEIVRLSDIWASAQGDFLFARAGIVDAFYAVMAYRLQTYAIGLDGHAGRYQRSLLAWPLMQEAIVEASRWVNT